MPLVLLAFVVSCSDKEQTPAPGGKTGQDISAYSPDSVFFEVKKKLEENPNDADAWYHLADLYDRNGQYPEAIDAYKKTIKLQPARGYTYFKMGTAYNELNKPDEAIAAFKKAIRYMPDYAATYNNLGIAYGKLGKVQEEIDALTKAVKLRPRYAIARYNLGLTYLKTNDKKAALREYESLKDYDKTMAEELMKRIKARPESTQRGKKKAP